MCERKEDCVQTTCTSVFNKSIALDGEQSQKKCDGEVAGVPMDSLLSPLEEPVDAE